MKIVHFSDLHLSAAPDSPKALFDKRLIGFLNGFLFRKQAYHPERIRKAIPMILNEKPDLIVFTGDATTCSQPAEFKLALEILKPLIDSGIPILYTPGNHDCYVTDHKCVRALREFRLALTGSESAPELFETPECSFLIFHSAVPTNPLLSCGYFSQESEDFLKKYIKTKTTVALSHFPVLNQEKGISGQRRKLYGADKIAPYLSNGTIELLLCGHIHKPYEILDQNGHGEICAGSLSKAGIFRVITIEKNNILVENKWIR